MKGFSLHDFIYQVKHELLDAQEQHEGEEGFLRLAAVELEVSVAVKKAGNGKMSIKVVEIGGTAGRDDTHRVKLAFTVSRWGAFTPRVSKGDEYFADTPLGEGDLKITEGNIGL
jgi:hypothetical protein